MDGGDSHLAMINGQSAVGTGPASKLPQYLVTLAATTVAFAGGTILGWSAPALPVLQAANSTLPVSVEEGSWVGSLLAVGAFVGALPAGTVADMVGRKYAILAMAVPQLVSWVLVYFASSVNTLYIARLLGGLGIGAICAIVPMYVAEIAEDSIRGTLGSAFQFMLVTGILYTYVLGAFLHVSLLPILCGIFYIIFFVVFFFAPESPMYLLKKDRRQQAEASLRTLRGPTYNLYKELHLMEKDIADQNSNKVSFFNAMRKRACVMSMIICIGMMVFQQLSGINIVIFYSGNIFADAGSKLDPAIATMIVGLAQVVATVVAAALIDRAGRKILLQLSASVMAVCLAVLGYYFHLKDSGSDITGIGMLPLVSVVIYILVFAVGFGPIPWMICGEVMSPEIKAAGTGLAVATNWSLAFAVTKAFQPLQSAVGTAVTYWIFAGINVLAFLFATFIVLETKGKSLSQVQEELSGRNKKNAVI